MRLCAADQRPQRSEDVSGRAAAAKFITGTLKKRATQKTLKNKAGRFCRSGKSFKRSAAIALLDE